MSAMPLQVSRPSVKQASVWTYDRPLHPELFHMLECGFLQSANATLRMGIHAAGHLLQVTVDEESISEVVTADAAAEMPTRGIRVRQALRTGHELRTDFKGPLSYQFTGHVESLADDLFAQIDFELQQDLDQWNLVWRPETGSRIETRPLSLIRVTVNGRNLCVHCYHTFPAEHAVLKTQSLFEF